MWDSTFFQFFSVLDRLHSKDTRSHHVGPHLVQFCQRFGSIANKRYRVPACGIPPFLLFAAFDWLQSKDMGSHHVGPHLVHFFGVLDWLQTKDTGSQNTGSRHGLTTWTLLCARRHAKVFGTCDVLASAPNQRHLACSSAGEHLNDNTSSQSKQILMSGDGKTKNKSEIESASLYPWSDGTPSSPKASNRNHKPPPDCLKRWPQNESKIGRFWQLWYLKKVTEMLSKFSKTELPCK